MILAFYSEASGTDKDTATRFAIDCLHRHGVAAVRDAFADDGKVVAADALGIAGTRAEKVAAIDRIKLGGEIRWDDGPSMLDGTKDGFVDGRQFVIGMLGSPGKGTGIRGLAPHFWTQQVIKRSRYATGWTVISDMRFLEEAEAVKADGGLIVELVRGKNLGTHNEQRLPAELIDCTIGNNGTLEDLQVCVEAFIDTRLREPAVR